MKKLILNIFIRLSRSEKFKALLKQCWSMSWPMIIIMLGDFFVSITDVYIAGKLGKEVQAAVGFTTQVYFLFAVISNALSVGTVSVISRIFTSESRSELSKAIFTIMTGVTVIASIFALLGITLAPTIMAHLNVPEQVKHYSIPLIRIYTIGILFHYILSNTNGILRSTQRVKRSMFTMLTISTMNIALNFIIVFHTPLGFLGIAISTAASYATGAFINFIYIRRKIRFIRSFSATLFKKMLSIAWPSGLLQVFWHLGSIVLFLIISNLPVKNSIEVIAGFTNGMRIEALIFLPAFAFNMSAVAIMGNLLGEDKKRDAFYSGIITALFSVAIVLLVSFFIILFAGELTSLLSSNMGVVHESTRYLIIAMMFEPLMAWGVVLGGALNGAGDTKAVMLNVILPLWLLRIPLAYILGIRFALGPVAVWWAMNASVFGQSCLATLRYFSKKWIDNKI